MNKLTVDYYNQNIEKFISDTILADMTENWIHFCRFLLQGSSVLDFGCGSGRDTLYFLQQGYQVDAIDGSESLCKEASEYTGLPVRHMYFQELEEKDKYDGIWACASILHLTYSELQDVFYRMAQALKLQGICYMSFKYGNFEGMRNGRYFLDMTEEKFRKLLAETEVFQLEEMWVTSDVRPGRAAEKWLNCLVRKKLDIKRFQRNE